MLALDVWHLPKEKAPALPSTWPSPPKDRVALSVGDSFSEEDGLVAAGMILR